MPHCNIAFLQNWHLANFLLVIYIVWLSLLPPFPFSQLVSPQLCISYLIPAAACTICGLDGWGEPPDPRRMLEEGSPPRFEVLRQHLCQHHHTPHPAPSLSACSAWTWGTASAATRTARSSPSSPTAGSAPPAQLVVKAWIQASGSLIWTFWTLCLIYW